MLHIKNVKKEYTTGTLVQRALGGVSLSFRKSELVAILGHSGSGKTTLLNIIGGLDKCDSGDLIINGVSTRKYKDRDWDTYRNHTIGFIFQSYNLIPHQSVLANVELALTLSGVSKQERRRRAKEALEKVGLGDHTHKRPNQLSGGQMQRVAIARALVNDPEILLADEPTGALDSDTGLQVMELLKEIAKDRLVIMVTHNAEIADAYASRIVRLKDGMVIDDSDPYEPDAEEIAAAEALAHNSKREGKKKKTSMSFFTALGLSINNLSTKKGRTVLTSFAGSIGIIGIALILALSTGIQNYVNAIQRDTLTAYPVSVTRSQSDIFSIMMTSRDIMLGENEREEDGKVHLNPKLYDMFNAAVGNNENENDLQAFKAFLDEKLSDTDKDKPLSELITALQYQYDIKLNTYVRDEAGEFRSTDFSKLFAGTMGNDESSSLYSMMSNRMTGANVWTELLSGTNGELVSPMLQEQYDIVCGTWPTQANEIVMIIDEHNEIPDTGFYALGLLSENEVMDIFSSVMKGESIETKEQSISYEDILDISMKLVLESDCYNKIDDRHFEYVGDDADAMSIIIENGYDLHICGIVKPNPDASANAISGVFGYTSELVNYIIDETNKSEVVIAQRSPENENFDVIKGLPFVTDESDELDEQQKALAINEYFASLSDAEKTDIYTQILSVPPEGYVEQAVAPFMEQLETREQMIGVIAESYGLSEEKITEYLSKNTDEEIRGMLRDGLAQIVETRYAEQAEYQIRTMMNDATQPNDLFGMGGYAAVAAQFDLYLSAIQDDAEFASLYDSYMPSGASGSTLADNLALLSAVDIDDPSSINIYADSFEDKSEIENVIKEYNNSVGEDKVIKYTDYVAVMLSGVNTMIDAVSYGLIAFVSISLVVSSIMIGIITYISVLERIKEIGVLRAIGASKRDVSSVFTAETLIIGFCAGIIGVGVSLLLCIPISAIIRSLSGINEIRAVLTPTAALILVGISMLLTFIAGLIPAKMAAKKDPVLALRAE